MAVTLRTTAPLVTYPSHLRVDDSVCVGVVSFLPGKLGSSLG